VAEHAESERSRDMLNITLMPTSAGFVGVTSVRLG
jgi:hypothetical protein